MLKTAIIASAAIAFAVEVDDAEWNQYKRQYKKHYADASDENARCAIPLPSH